MVTTLRTLATYLILLTDQVSLDAHEGIRTPFASEPSQYKTAIHRKYCTAKSSHYSMKSIHTLAGTDLYS